jgi:ribosome-associated translation inhibitor RaiA
MAKSQNKRESLKTGTIKKISHQRAEEKKKQAKKDARGKASSQRLKKSLEKEKNKTQTSLINSIVINQLGIKNTITLDSFVKKQSTSLLRRISSKPEKYKLKFKLSPNARKRDGTISSFEAEAKLSITGVKEIVIKTKNKDPKTAIEIAFKKLEAKIQRETEKVERSRKTAGKSLKPVKELVWDIALNHN